MNDVQEPPNDPTAKLEPVSEWARVEIFGHRIHFGRVTEADRFGAKMLRLDQPTADPEVFETLFYGGSSIFSLTPLTEAECRRLAERFAPVPYRRASALPAPASKYDLDAEEPEDAA